MKEERVIKVLIAGRWERGVGERDGREGEGSLQGVVSVTHQRRRGMGGEGDGVVSMTHPRKRRDGGVGLA